MIHVRAFARLGKRKRYAAEILRRHVTYLKGNGWKIIADVPSPTNWSSLSKESRVSQTELNQLVSATARRLRSDLGGLDDIPEHLRAVIIAIYYRSFQEFDESRRPGWLPRSVRERGLNAMSYAISDIAFFGSAMQTIPGFVDCLR